LNQLLGENAVRRKIQSDDAYEVLRAALVSRDRIELRGDAP
jgi:hypothetical protein